MALNNDQEAYFQTRLGSAYDSYDAEQRLIRLGGDGYESAVVVEVLEQRLADLSLKPASFTVPGEYSEDRSKNIALIQQQITEARAEASADGTLENPDARIVEAAPFAVPTFTLDTEEFYVRGGRSRYGSGR